MNQNRTIKFSLVTAALVIGSAQINMLHAADFPQQAPVVYDGTNRAYETPPVGGWEGVLEREEAELKRSLSGQGNTDMPTHNAHTWDAPQRSQSEMFSVPQNPQSNVYNVPQKDITWDKPDPYQKQSEFYTDTQNVWGYPQQGNTFGAQQRESTWDAPGSQPQSGYYAAPPKAPDTSTQNNTYTAPGQNNAWDAPQSQQGEYYPGTQSAPQSQQGEYYPGAQAAPPSQQGGYSTGAQSAPQSQQGGYYPATQNAPQQYNRPDNAYPAPQNTTGSVMPRRAYPAPQQNTMQTAPATQQPQQRMNTATQQAAPGVAATQDKPYSMPTDPAWDDPQVAQGIWNHRAGGVNPSAVPQQGAGGPRYRNRGYGNRGNTMPGFGGSGFRGPWNSGNSGSSFMPFGGRNSGGMFNPGGGSVAPGWGDSMNRPGSGGIMPGGISAP